MKKILCAIAVVWAFASCTEHPQKDYIVLSGNILNSNQDSLTFVNDGRDYSFKGNYFFEKKIPLSKEGYFCDTIFEPLPSGSYFLNEAKNYVSLVITPGYHDLKINYDASNLKETLTIAGKGATISNYILSKETLLDSIKSQLKLYSKPSYKDPEYFQESSLKIKDATIDNLNKNKDLPKDFFQQELKGIAYGHLYRMFRLYRYNKYEPDFNVNMPIYKTTLEAIDTVSLDNEDQFLFFSSPYASLVYDIYREKAENIVDKDSTLDISIETLKQVASNPKDRIRNELIYVVGVKDALEFTEDLEWLYTAVVDAHTERFSPDYYKDLGLKHPELKKGMPSPEFVDYYNYFGGTTSLSDFKGRYVYIDVWATWCFPCRAEIPFVKKLEKEYHGKNLAFVSISIDDEKHFEKWKSIVDKLGLKGNQLNANGKAFDADFAKKYQIKYIPRFILIDPEGKIVSANAPRPSDRKLKDMLNTLNL